MELEAVAHPKGPTILSSERVVAHSPRASRLVGKGGITLFPDRGGEARVQIVQPYGVPWQVSPDLTSPSRVSCIILLGSPSCHTHLETLLLVKPRVSCCPFLFWLPQVHLEVSQQVWNELVNLGDGNVLANAGASAGAEV